MKTNLFFLLISVIIFVYGCEKDPISGKTNNVNIASISPSKGVIGTKLKIYDNIPSGLKIGSVSIFFPYVCDWIIPDSISDDTIYTHVPFGARSGDIKVNFSRDSLIIKNFSITEESLDEVKVCWSDLNYLIDEKISTYTIGPVSKELKWSVGIIQDTVKITTEYYPGEYVLYYHMELLNKGVNQLPQFILGYGLMDTDYGEKIIYKLKKGIIKIQDWNVDSLISGRVLSTPWKNDNYIFWYKFDKSNSHKTDI